MNMLNLKIIKLHSVKLRYINGSDTSQFSGIGFLGEFKKIFLLDQYIKR